MHTRQEQSWGNYATTFQTSKVSNSRNFMKYSAHPRGRTDLPHFKRKHPFHKYALCDVDFIVFSDNKTCYSHSWKVFCNFLPPDLYRNPRNPLIYV